MAKVIRPSKDKAMNTATNHCERTAMRPGFTIAPMRVLLSPLATPRPQPSLRIPVTPGNRACLRAMRAAEEAAWVMAELRTGGAI